MTRRITRTLAQLGALLLLLTLLLFIADTRYKVLPAALHHHLPSHHAGSVITDITLAFCSKANPFSACRLDPAVWHRVEKDLYLQSGWLSSAWVHVQRKREEELGQDDQVIVGVRVGRLDPGMGESGRSGERWEARPGGIWILRGPARKESDSSHAVTAIDVLFGADAVDPRPGWSLASSALLVDTANAQHTPRLSVRHGQPKPLTPATPPRVRKDGRFKILQVSDAHLSTGTGHCRDAIGPDNQPSGPTCEADLRTLAFLETILDSEKPDLVVLSGDQIEGPQAPDTQSALFKLAVPLIERSIPYAAIFGNHDDESPHAYTLTRAAQMSLLQTLPYSLSIPGPADLEGVGNYYLEIPGHSTDSSALTLYLLDSHSLTPDEKHYPGYDWLKPAQIAWFNRTAASLKKAHTKYSHIHLDVAFIHIPLPEYRDSSNLIAGGSWREGVTAPNYNSGFFSALQEAGVVAVGCGHDHVNDYCALPPHTSGHSRGPWLCYAGGSGFGGYAGYGGFHRRVRVWEVDANAGRMSTWKRVECCGEDVEKNVDEIVVVEGGRVVAPEK